MKWPFFRRKHYDCRRCKDTGIVTRTTAKSVFEPGTSQSDFLFGVLTKTFMAFGTSTYRCSCPRGRLRP